MPLKILHFSDAHIGAVNHGKRDALTDLPLRVMDYLKSLDMIVNTAIEEHIDLVIFSGDAYHHRNPTITLQREWGKRIMRLSQAKIPSLLLVGNHDLSPSLNRAHTLDGFQTFQAANVIVVDQPRFLEPEHINGLPLQIIAIPWIARSGLMAHFGLSAADPALIYEKLEGNLADLISTWLENRNPNIPTILTAHASVQGASYGHFRTITLGSEMTLSPSLMKDSRLSYVGLGHLHYAQDLNPGNQPPVIYAGSIERVDFGEASETKYFMIAHIENGKPTEVQWREIPVRPFIDSSAIINIAEDFPKKAFQALSPRDKLKDAMVRLVLEYPSELTAAIEDGILREFTSEAFEFHFIRRPKFNARIRLPEDRAIGSLSPEELLEVYLKSTHNDDSDDLIQLGKTIIYYEADGQIPPPA